MARYLTGKEIRLLQDVYRNTLRYEAIECDVNVMNLGGERNSITPGGMPHFSRRIYCADFSRAHELDYWGLSARDLPPEHNINKNPSLSDYQPLIDELWKSGPSIRKLDQNHL